VGLDVIRDHTSDDETFFQTVSAERMFAHLKTSLRLPSTKAVPVARFVRVLHFPNAYFRMASLFPNGKSAARTGRKALRVGGNFQGDNGGKGNLHHWGKARSGGLGAKQYSIAPQFRLGQNGLKIE
jgi:hypothetical protein